MAINVVQNVNTDGVTITIRQNDEGINNLTSNIVFSDKEITIGDYFINGGGTGKLVFREIVNHTKTGRSMMVCTGFEYMGKWYGDRPDKGELIDVFNGQQKVFIDDSGNAVPELQKDFSYIFNAEGMVIGVTVRQGGNILYSYVRDNTEVPKESSSYKYYEGSAPKDSVEPEVYTWDGLPDEAKVYFKD